MHECEPLASGAAEAGGVAAASGLTAAGVPPIAGGSLAQARMGGGMPAPEPGAGRAGKILLATSSKPD